MTEVENRGHIFISYAWGNGFENCSGLLTPDTHLGENARHREVSDDQTTPYVYP